MAPKRRRDWQAEFLRALDDGARLEDAATVARVAQRTTYSHRHRDPAFGAKVAQAQHEAAREDAVAALHRNPNPGPEELMRTLARLAPDTWGPVAGPRARAPRFSSKPVGAAKMRALGKRLGLVP